jgi:hypothetical protein
MVSTTLDNLTAPAITHSATPDGANAVFLAKTSSPRPFDVVHGTGSQMHICCSAPASSPAVSKATGAKGILSFGGPPGEFISSGKQLTLSYPVYKVSITQPGPGDIQMEFDRGDAEYDANFSTGSNERFGTHMYSQAQRYDMGNPGKPGLEISGDGRACNGIVGSFQVSNAEYRPDGTITKFAATFEQWCDDSKTPARGSVSVSSQ